MKKELTDIGKICTLCRKEKRKEDFVKDTNIKSGYRSRCKDCTEMTKICGIYKITSPTGKIYIGQSKDVKNRWSSYRTRGAKAQTILDRSFVKYEVESHIFEIIEECDELNLDLRERYWQEKLEVVGRNGLNCHYTKIEGRVSVMTEESRVKRSLSKMGELNHNSKDIFDCSSFVFYYSVGEASKVLDINKNTLYGMLKGTFVNKTSLIFTEDFEKGKLPNTLFTPKIGRKKRKQTGYEVIDYASGKIVGDVKQVAKECNIKETSLRAYLNGVCSNKTNYIYNKDYIKGLNPNELFSGKIKDIKIIDFTTYMVFDTIKEACAFYKVSYKYIDNCLKNTKESALPIILLSDYKEDTVYEYSPEKFEKRNNTILNLNDNIKYKNHQEVSNHLNISTAMVSKILSFLCYNLHGIIYERDYIKGLLPNYKLNKVKKEVVDITTGIKYKSIREACRNLDIGNSQHSRYIKNKNYEKTNLRYV